MITSTVENYLKALFLLDQNNEKQVATGELAKALNLTPGSVTTMIKTLAEAGLVNHRPHYGMKLTKSGRALAVRVVRRHRIVELFLVKILAMDWGEVHAEAEQLEHVVSDVVIDRMDKLLGYPTFDPHGDPIPKADGSLPIRSLRQLSFCENGEQVLIARIGDQDTTFLKFAENAGLTLGEKIKIINRNDITDSITVQSRSQEIVLGLSAAGRIEVENA
ncbi:MAG: metal-dependent transcriptional regulator [Planctomycetota bacterium]|nr:metal-dependent transcriptional regulator [Planctomycetota bacterium]